MMMMELFLMTIINIIIQRIEQKYFYQESLLLQFAVLFHLFPIQLKLNVFNEMKILKMKPIL